MKRRTLIKSFATFGLVAPVSIVKATPSPDERIAAAQEIIRQAFAEKYGVDWEIEVNKPQMFGAISGQTGERFDIGEVLVISALDPKHSYGRTMTATYDEDIEFAADRKCYGEVFK